MNGIELLTVLALVGLTPAAAIAGIRASSRLHWHAELVAYDLRFPRGLKAEAVTAFLTHLSGVVAPRLRRPFVTRTVILETSATSGGIAHHLVVSRSLAHVVLSALRAAMPAVAVRLDETYRAPAPRLVTELAMSHHGRMLATDRVEAISSALLASLHPLHDGERLVVQWLLSPLGPRPLPTSQPHQAIWQALSGQQASAPDAEVIKAARTKHAAPVFACLGQVGVVAAPNRAKSLMLRVLASLHVANDSAHLHRRYRPQASAIRRMASHHLPLVECPCTLNAAELAGLVAFPVGETALPGLRLGGARQLAPASDIPSVGRVVARATFPGAERPLALSVPDSLRHLHVIGPTGSGKSTMLTGLIAGDMEAGRGVVVLDPKGDLVADVLERVPAHRLDDVCILDPGDDERPVGLNLLAATEADRELVTEQVVGTLHNLYRASWGPRTDDVLRSALLTLVGVPGMTLAEVPLLLTDAAFRRRLVGRIDDPIALGPFWAAYEAMSDAERAQVIGPVMNKLRAFLLRRRLRNVIGQAEPKLDLDQALSTNKILLVPLRKGVLGEEAAALIGSLVVAKVWQAVQRRTSLPANQRPTTFMVIDEFQDYLKIPMSVADVLAQARGLGLGLTLAHQHLGQLPKALQDAVLANARSRVIFQTSADDARTLARELAPHLDATDLQGLGAYEVVASLSAGARVAPPVTAVTMLPPAPTGYGEHALARSRRCYGQDREEVEQPSVPVTPISHRPAPGPVGRCSHDDASRSQPPRPAYRSLFRSRRQLGRIRPGQDP